MYCTNCGHQVADNAAVCTSCGYRPRQMRNYCWNCGTATSPGQAACVQCGVALGPIAGTGAKSKVAAGLLALFLGTIGIHKFYLGYNTAGVIMLLVSIIGAVVTLGIATGVMALIAFIEGIIYLTKSDEEFDQIYVQNQRQWF